MLRLRTVAGCCLFAALALFAGCAKEESKTTPAAPKADEQKAAEQKTEATTDKTAAELPGGLKELSPEDLAAVQKQKVCPVTDEELGSMGKPYKTTVKGQTVFLCCSHCEEELKKDPDKYLAKLKKE